VWVWTWVSSPAPNTEINQMKRYPRDTKIVTATRTRNGIQNAVDAVIAMHASTSEPPGPDTTIASAGETSARTSAHDLSCD